MARQVVSKMARGKRRNKNKNRQDSTQATMRALRSPEAQAAKDKRMDEILIGVVIDRAAKLQRKAAREEARRERMHG